jgi:hypothetical protein
MKKIAVLAVAAAALLAVAATAQAKEIVGLKVCGTAGCNEIKDRVSLGGEDATFATAQPGPYYTVEIGFGDSGNIVHREQGFWLPATNMIRFAQPGAMWWQLASPSLFKDAAAGLEPFVPRLSRVTVAGKAAADPSSYLALLGTFRGAVLPRGKLHLTRIVLRSSTSNPWVDRVAGMGYDAKRRLLVRSDGYYRLPASLGKLVMARASLAKASTGSGGGSTALVAGLGVGAIAAIALLGFAKLRKMT